MERVTYNKVLDPQGAIQVLEREMVQRNKELADAQATIAALQAEVKELEQIAISHDQSMRYITGQAKRTHEKLTTVQATLTQRTAELEAANKRIHDLECQHQDLCLRNQILRDRPDLPVERASFHAEVVRMQAELERVRGQYAELGKMVLALPKVEGEIEVSSGVYNFILLKRDTVVKFLCGQIETEQTAQAIAALWEHRQGMEG